MNAFYIKLFLMLLMLFDHIYFSFPDLMPFWIHPISRCVAPMFAYFIVEGYYYTKDKFKYGARLFIFALIMQVGNSIINNLFISKQIIVYNNIFLTLFVGYILIATFEQLKNKYKLRKIALLFLVILEFLIGILFTEGGISMIPFILITYFFRNNKRKMFLGYTILSLILFFMTFKTYPTVRETFEMMMFNSDFLLILSIPIILLYNGERGLNNNFSKYLFYLFYPLHIWGLAYIEFLVK